jgi:putative copper resistance protein D
VLVDPLIAARGVHFAATVLASGTVVFIPLVMPHDIAATADHAALRRRLIGLAWGALVLCILSGAAWLALVASDILGAPLTEVCLHGGVWRVAGETRFGAVACARLIVAVTLGLLLLRPSARWLQLAAAVSLVSLIALTGHAGAGTGTAGDLHLVSDMIHLTAAGAWIGALPALAMLLLWSRADAARSSLAVAATQRFSVLGIICVTALLVSGLINSWALLGSPGDLIATAYGRLLALKIGLFAAMVAIAAVNRYHLTVRLPEQAAMRALARNIWAETVLGLTIFFIVGALGTLPPPGHLHVSSAAIPPDAAFVHIHSEQAMADLTINPGHAGKTTATIRLSREDSAPVTAKSVRLALDPSNDGLATIERTALFTADGTWVIADLNIPASGIWTARVIIDLGAGPIVLDAPIVITQCSNEC